MLKQITSIFIIFLGLIFLAATVFAQSDEVLAKKYGITFPITELGNCTSVAVCKTFCDNPQNHQKCGDFAKMHNLSGDSPKISSTKSEEEMLKLARVELGCNSYDECVEFCEKEENMEKCMDFASRHNLDDGGNAAQMKQQISALKNLLGCNSMKTCMDFCNSPANMQKCMEVFKQAGFSVEASYSGPGGCDSEQSCQAYCEKNPKECGGDNFQSEPPEAWCSKLATDCKWDGTTCMCGGNYSPQESGEIWCPKAGSGCKWDSNQCICPGETTSVQESNYQQESPEVWCPKASQGGQICSWDGTSCTCWDPEGCKQASGCAWTGTKCECTASSEPINNVSEPGEVWCPRNPGCNWTGTDCQCNSVKASQAGEQTSAPVVQGAKTNRSLLQQISDFILRR